MYSNASSVTYEKYIALVYHNTVFTNPVNIEVPASSQMVYKTLYYVLYFLLFLTSWAGKMRIAWLFVFLSVPHNFITKTKYEGVSQLHQWVNN